MDIRLIVFDVDGTLAETDDYIVEKYAVMIRKILPFLSEESIAKVVRPVVMAGETVVHGCYRLLDLIGLDGVISKLHSKFSVRTEYKYKEVDGMRETLSCLSENYLLGIITSGGHQSTDAFIKKFHLEPYISYVISAEDCKYIKPHPMPLQKIAEAADVPIQNCLMVGDTIFDILCARRAGAKSAAVKSGFDSEKLLQSLHADVILDTVNELPAMLH